MQRGYCAATQPAAGSNRGLPRRGRSPPHPLQGGRPCDDCGRQRHQRAMQEAVEVASRGAGARAQLTQQSLPPIRMQVVQVASEVSGGTRGRMAAVPSSERQPRRWPARRRASFPPVPSNRRPCACTCRLRCRASPRTRCCMFSRCWRSYRRARVRKRRRRRRPRRPRRQCKLTSGSCRHGGRLRVAGQERGDWVWRGLTLWPAVQIQMRARAGILATPPRLPCTLPVSRQPTVVCCFSNPPVCRPAQGALRHRPRQAARVPGGGAGQAGRRLHRDDGRGQAHGGPAGPSHGQV